MIVKCMKSLNCHQQSLNHQKKQMNLLVFLHWMRYTVDISCLEWIESARGLEGRIGGDGGEGSIGGTFVCRYILNNKQPSSK